MAYVLQPCLLKNSFYRSLQFELNLDLMTFGKQNKKRLLWNKDTKSWQLIICDIFYFFYVHYSTLFYLPPLRFHYVEGCWNRTQGCHDIRLLFYLLFTIWLCCFMPLMSLSVCTFCTGGIAAHPRRMNEPSRTLIGMYHPPLSPLSPPLSSLSDILSPDGMGGRRHSQCCQLSPRFFG